MLIMLQAASIFSINKYLTVTSDIYTARIPKCAICALFIQAHGVLKDCERWNVCKAFNIIISQLAFWGSAKLYYFFHNNFGRPFVILTETSLFIRNFKLIIIKNF